MESRIYLKYIFIFLIVLMLIPSSVYANSSWHWISNSRPIDILPFVIIGTLLIEILMIIKLNKIKYIVKSIIVISIANIISFVVPYLFYFIHPDAKMMGMSGYEYFIEMTRHLPTYIVGTGYLFLTLIVEVPIVYYLLKKDCNDNNKLLRVVIIANIITTIFVAIIERIICIGQW